MGRPRRKDQPYRVGEYTLGWRGDVAVADFRDPLTGRRQRVRLGKLKGESAKTALNRFVEARRAIQKNQDAPTIGQIWDLWLADRAKDGFSNKIYEHNWTALKGAFATKTPSLLTADDCRDYARTRFALGRKPWTVHTELARLRYCLKWAGKRDIIPKVPYVWTPSKGSSRTRVLSYDEARALLGGAGDPHIKLFILLALTTGARHAAILDLTWDRVDWDKGTVQYDDDLSPDPMSKAWRKGRATVPIGPVLRAELELAYRGRQTMHVIEHGARRLKSVRDGFEAAVQRAGLGSMVPHPAQPGRLVFETDVTPHVMRHSVATWARERGDDFHRIASLLGHADSKTSELIYAHVDTGTYLRRTIEVIDAEFAAVPSSNPELPVNNDLAGGRVEDLSQLGQNGVPEDGSKLDR